MGTSFTSKLTSEFFSRFGIKMRYSSICHPESNVVEQLHSTLKCVMKALCVENRNDREENLPLGLVVLRTITHESIGYNSGEWVFGKRLLKKEKTNICVH